MRELQGDCLAVIGSMTQAIRAQKVLSGAAIRAEVVKSEGGRTLGGCAYALSYPCAQDKNVRTVLQNAGLRVRAFSKGRVL